MMDLTLSEIPERLRDKFYHLRTVKDLANLLEIDLNTLIYNIYKVPDTARYKSFSIPKKSGGARIICAPSTTLKIIQRKLNSILQSVYEPRRSTHGFVLKRSIVTNGGKHCKRRLVLNIDLEQFFPSINFGRVRGLFMSVPYCLSSQVSTTIAQICCFNNELPQGAPTSPIIANMICWKLDKELELLAKQCRCAYTRYADDITLSTSRWEFPPEIVKITDPSGSGLEVGQNIVNIIENNGFKINNNKIRLRNYNQRQEVTGLTTNQFPNVQRKYVRNVRAMIHAWGKFGFEAAERDYLNKHKIENRNPFNSDPRFDHVLRGRISFLKMVRGKDDQIYIKFQTQVEKLMLNLFKQETVSVIVSEPSKVVISTPSQALLKNSGKLILDYMKHSNTNERLTGTPISTRKNLFETEIKIHDIITTGQRKDQVRVCLVQLDYSIRLQKPPLEFAYVLKDNQKDIVKQKVFSALEIGRREKVNIICFPELSIDKEWLNDIQTDFKDIIIIAGSHYQDRFNSCPVLISGERYLVHKINPSPILEGSVAADRGMEKGNEVHLFKTEFGNFLVLICIDYLKEFRRSLEKIMPHGIPVDMVINPSCNPEVIDFQNQANLDCKYSEMYPYILQTNILRLNNKLCDGTCIIGIEHSNSLRRYGEEGFRKERDPITYKLFETYREENIIIASLNINRKGEFVPAHQLKMRGACRYFFENGRWSLKT